MDWFVGRHSSIDMRRIDGWMDWLVDRWTKNKLMSRWNPCFTPIPFSADSVVSLKRSFHIISKTPRVPPEEFSRKTLAEFFHKLTNYILNNCEDDTKSMLAIVNVRKFVYTCLCECTCNYMCVYIHIYVHCTYVFMYMYMSIYVYVHMHVHYIHVYVHCTYVFMYMYMYNVLLYIICQIMYTCMYNVHVHVHICTCICTCICMYMYMYNDMCVCVCTHIICTCSYVFMYNDVCKCRFWKCCCLVLARTNKHTKEGELF